ncbi:hypothetical protein [Nocardioides kribbensis]|uniref:hypothetical protein n=1 Tax=Nocardioides kribbensis TaxID=305517 RepID=UPI00187A90B5|nr:hypothetical protein [Nocardioides kribbensis]
MKREWKPGDVALIPLGSADVRAMFTTDGWAISDMPGVRGVREFSDVRPLVVIDPEDREQVERLLSAYWVERNPEDPGDARRYPGYVSDLQAALREFANPTPLKPEVYEHIVVSGPRGPQSAICGKVWEPSEHVTVVGKCPECVAQAARWVA